MKDLYQIELDNQEDIEAMAKWCNEVYIANFGSHFKQLHSLSDILSSSTRPMTDEELEWALSTLPLQMLEASEILSQFRVNEQILKLKLKKILRERPDNSERSLQPAEENKLLTIAYSSVISRAEGELSACREFIMAVKKIWDSRQKSVLPIQPVDTSPQLPQYIKGGV